MEGDTEATALILESLFDIRAGVAYLVSRATEEEDDYGSEETEED